ncbi:type VI secretion system tube protein TssD [Hymenobacter terrenus]|uniref:type VI secretion system tube protein TssD n=1 Tax=Hymenobacter terrenus TaxID=1629124 RepID=UPI0006195AF7|nr:type VI secretion system tube protein TssD [Hymenobacter terrenus]
MASFYAELRVAGHVYPLRYCTYGVQQATGERGRPVERVRHGRLDAVADVPADDFLPDWAATPHRPLAGHVVFYDVQGGPPRETVSWEAGHCVDYQETFESGNAAEGSYVCHVSIAAPKLAFNAGGPATAFVVPPARDHGTPPVAVMRGCRPTLRGGPRRGAAPAPHHGRPAV